MCLAGIVDPLVGGRGAESGVCSSCVRAAERQLRHDGRIFRSLATSGCEGNRKKKKPRVCLQVCMVGAVFVAPAGQYSCARCSQPCPATTVLFCLLVMS